MILKLAGHTQGLGGIHAYSPPVTSVPLLQLWRALPHHSLL